jgi:hypothetical protein
MLSSDPAICIVNSDSKQDEFLSRKVMDWLFLVLRFAITHDENDRRAVSALAQQMDSLGTRFGLVDHGFFLRTSADVCMAITEPTNPRSFGPLRAHAQRIEHPRLRNCFRTAVDLAEIARVPNDRVRKPSVPANLWAGLHGSSAADLARK